MAAPPKHAISEDRIAELAGISTTTWRAHKVQGCPVPKNKADLVGWLGQYQAWRRKHGKVPSLPSTSLPPVDPETQRHKRDHSKWRALLAQLEVGVKTKALISRTEVVDYIAKANITCRSRLNLLVQKMKTRLVNCGEEFIEKELRAEVDSICAAFAQGMLIAHEHASGTGTPSAGLVEATEDPDGE